MTKIKVAKSFKEQSYDKAFTHYTHCTTRISENSHKSFKESPAKRELLFFLFMFGYVSFCLGKRYIQSFRKKKNNLDFLC